MVDLGLVFMASLCEYDDGSDVSCNGCPGKGIDLQAGKVEFHLAQVTLSELDASLIDLCLLYA